MLSLLSRPLIGPLIAGASGVIAGGLFIALLSGGSKGGTGHGGLGALALWLLVVSGAGVAGLVGMVMTIRKASRRIGLLTLSAALGLLIGLIGLAD